MSAAKKCDLCGILYEEYNEGRNWDNKNLKGYNGIAFLNLDIQMKYFTGKTMDLCPSCLNDLINFLDSHKNHTI